MWLIFNIAAFGSRACWWSSSHFCTNSFQRLFNLVDFWCLCYFPKYPSERRRIHHGSLLLHHTSQHQRRCFFFASFATKIQLYGFRSRAAIVWGGAGLVTEVTAGAILIPYSCARLGSNIAWAFLCVCMCVCFVLVLQQRWCVTSDGLVTCPGCSSWFTPSPPWPWLLVIMQVVLLVCPRCFSCSWLITRVCSDVRITRESDPSGSR